MHVFYEMFVDALCEEAGIKKEKDWPDRCIVLVYTFDTGVDIYFLPEGSDIKNNEEAGHFYDDMLDWDLFTNKYELELDAYGLQILFNEEQAQREDEWGAGKNVN